MTARWSFFVLRRLGLAAVAILGVATVTFFVTRMMANPVHLIAGPQVGPEQIEAIERQHGLDRSVPEQYVGFLGDLVQGDLGTSFRTAQPVVTEISERLPATLELALASLFVALLVACPLGCLAAIKRGGRLDSIARHGSSFFIAMPGFWLGLMLILLFYYVLGVAPPPIGRLDGNITPPESVTGFLIVDSVLAGDPRALGSALGHLMLPALAVGLTTFPAIFQLTRDTMVRVLDSDYIRAARSLGLPARQIYLKYALRNVLVPVMTLAAMALGWLIGSTVLIEIVFAWPGIGLYAVDSIRNFDYAPVVGVVILTATIYVVIYTVTDLVAFSIDPRTRG